VSMKPCNKFLLVEVLEYQDDEGKGLMYTSEKLVNPYTAVEVITLADDCSLSVYEGDIVIVNTHGIQEISVYMYKGLVVPEHHVISIIEEEEA